MTTPAPGLIVAAPASGSGKTVVTLALLRAFRNAGVAVASAKAGPDYIDPAFHSAASGADCINLDGWGLRERVPGDVFCRGGVRWDQSPLNPLLYRHHGDDPSKGRNLRCKNRDPRQALPLYFCHF